MEWTALLIHDVHMKEFFSYSSLIIIFDLGVWKPINSSYIQFQTTKHSRHGNPLFRVIISHSWSQNLFSTTTIHTAWRFSEYDSSATIAVWMLTNTVCVCYSMRKKFQGNPNIKHLNAKYRETFWKWCAQSMSYSSIFGRNCFISMCIDIDIDIVRFLSKLATYSIW